MKVYYLGSLDNRARVMDIGGSRYLLHSDKVYKIEYLLILADCNGFHQGSDLELQQDVESENPELAGCQFLALLAGPDLFCFWHSGSQGIRQFGDQYVIDPHRQPDVEPYCDLPGHEEHTHCEIHGTCIPVGTGCPDCMDAETRSSQEAAYWEQRAEQAARSGSREADVEDEFPGFGSGGHPVEIDPSGIDEFFGNLPEEV